MWVTSEIWQLLFLFLDGEDYNGIDTTLTFGPTVTSASVNVTLIDDNLLEDVEQLRAQLAVLSGGLSVHFSSNQTVFVSIISDDSESITGQD